MFESICMKAIGLLFAVSFVFAGWLIATEGLTRIGVQF